MKVSHVHDREGYIELQVEGPFSIPGLEGLVNEITGALKGRSASRLLLNMTGITVGKPLTTMERYAMGMAAVRLPKGLRIAALSRMDLLDPERFGQRVAQNRGAQIQVFVDEPAAVAWLKC